MIKCVSPKICNVYNIIRVWPIVYTVVGPRRLRWLGHVRRMEDCRIPNDILYGELALGRRTARRPPSTAIQRCLHKRHEGCRHRHYVLGGPCGRSHGVEECSETTPRDRGKETDGCSSRQTSTQKGGQQLHPTRSHT